MPGDAGAEAGGTSPSGKELVERTRSAVLNVLIVVGGGIAATGLLLRGREPIGAPREARDILLGALFAVFASGMVLRRVLGRPSRLRDRPTRAGRFYRAHLLPALAGPVAVALGFVHGRWISPELHSVLPYWIAGLAAGALALPREAELEGLDEEPEGRG